MSCFPPLRPYQTKAIGEVTEALKTSYSVVLSTCPGGGKTLMALDVAEPVLASGKTVLVLTHGTKMLLTQWQESVAKYGMGSAHLILVLPQAINHIAALLQASGLPLGLLIVDEAHEFYHAEVLVQQIIKRFKPEHELLLTGTPAKFVYDNQHRKQKRPIIVTSGVEVYTEGLKDKRGPFLQDTYFGMVKSAYMLQDREDYNNQGDAKETWSPKAEDTSSSLDALVSAMLDRLRQTVGKGSLMVTNLSMRMGPRAGAWARLFGKLHKTMIAAHSIAQAQDIRDVLERQGVHAALSESETDVDSLEIERFKTEPEVKVLIVVRRGILGFDLPELCNVVDMTCSRNINRIYQLYARVLRPHAGHDKSFFRLASGLNPAVDSFFVQAALCLNDRDFLLRYTGNNLNSLEILVPKTKRLKTLASARGKGGKRKVGAEGTEQVVVDALLADEILGLGLMSEMALNSGSKLWNEYEAVKFGQVVERLTGRGFVQDWTVSFEECKAFHAEHGSLPSIATYDRDEKRLANWLANATAPSSSVFRSEVRSWAAPLRVIQPWVVRFNECKKFFANHGRLPIWSATDSYEKHLASWLSEAFCQSGHNSHQEVRDWAEPLRKYSRWETNFEKIKEFYSKYSRLPGKEAKDDVERSLGQWFNGITSPSNPRFRQEVSDWAYPFRRQISFITSFELCKGFYAASGRLPRQSGGDKDEGRLGRWLCKSVCASDRQFRQEVRDWRDAIWAQEAAAKVPDCVAPCAPTSRGRPTSKSVRRSIPV